MMYKDLVADFADRTQRNLKFIDEAAKQGQSVYESTQLINSMLGLLVFPQQQFIDKIPKISLSELEARGWPRIEMNATSKCKCVNLRDFIRRVRNSIAHFNIEFMNDHSGNISGIKVWNDSKYGKRNWEADFKLSDLRGIAERFVEILREKNLLEQR